MGFELAYLGAILPGFGRGYLRAREQRDQREDADRRHALQLDRQAQETLEFELRKLALEREQHLVDLRTRVAGMELEDMQRLRGQADFARERLGSPGGGGVPPMTARPRDSQDTPSGPVTPAMISGTGAVPGRHWTPPSWTPERQRLIGMLPEKEQEPYLMELAREDYQARMQADWNRLEERFSYITQLADGGAILLPPGSVEALQQEAQAIVSGTLPGEIGDVYRSAGELVRFGQFEMTRAHGKQAVNAFVDQYRSNMGPASLLDEEDKTLSRLLEIQMDIGDAKTLNLDLSRAESSQDKSMVLGQHEARIRQLVSTAQGLSGPSGAVVAGLLEERDRALSEVRQARMSAAQGGGAAGAPGASVNPVEAMDPEARAALAAKVDDAKKRGDERAAAQALEDAGLPATRETMRALWHVSQDARKETSVSERMKSGGPVAQPERKRAGAASAIPGASDEKFARILELFDLPPTMTRDEAIEALMRPMLVPQKPDRRPGGSRGDRARGRM